MKAAFFSKLARACALGLVLALTAPSASAQTAGALLTGLTRNGGPLTVGTPANYSWNVPEGMYFVIATVTYALQSTRTDTGGGVAAIRCNVHRASEGAIDSSMATTSPTATTASAAMGEMTLAGRFSAAGAPTTLTVTCQNVGNARSSARVDHLQVNLVPVSGYSTLEVAP